MYVAFEADTSPSKITAVTPAGAGPGAVNVTVTNTDSQIGSALKAFRYQKSPPMKTALKVKSRAKNQALKPGQKATIVRTVKTDGTIRAAKVQCLVKGNKRTGQDKKATCRVSTKITSKNVRIRVTPKCSAALRIKAVLKAKAPGLSAATWKRTWNVKNQPRIQCAVAGKG